MSAGFQAGSRLISRRYVVHVRLLWRAAPSASLACLALTVVAAGARTAALLTTGRLVGAITAVRAVPRSSQTARDAAAATVWWWLVATAAVLLAAPIASAAQSYGARAAAARYLVLVCDGTAELGTHSYGLADVEEPATATRLRALHRVPGDWLFLAGIEATWTLLSIRLTGVGAAILLASWSWWAALALLAGCRSMRGCSPGGARRCGINCWTSPATNAGARPTCAAC